MSFRPGYFFIPSAIALTLSATTAAIAGPAIDQLEFDADFLGSVSAPAAEEPIENIVLQSAVAHTRATPWAPAWTPAPVFGADAAAIAVAGSADDEILSAADQHPMVPLPPGATAGLLCLIGVAVHIVRQQRRFGASAR